MTTAATVLSLGSNLGRRTENLLAALEILDRWAPVSAVSDIWETAPVGGVEQSAFLNLVALLATDDPDFALSAGHAAEDARGRLRPLRWGPRTLDVDVVACGPARRDDPRLTLPHPRAHERAFVLRPWLDVDRDAVLPGRGSVRTLLTDLGAEDVRRVGAAPGWWR